jgi:AraC family transcriptional regulator, transcriptional activator FtrA
MTIIRKIMPNLAQRAPLPNRLVAVLAYDGMSIFELGIAVEVFGLADMGPDWYRVVVCGERKRRRIAAGNGVGIVTDVGLGSLAQAGTIIVPGWEDVAAIPPEPMLVALRRAHRRGARIASICSGAFILAAARLLDGRRATAHWAHTDILARRYPRARIDAGVLYVDDGDILTSAGRAAGLDLCLHIVRRDFGAEIANRVARRLVIAPHREGGQAQFIARPVAVEGDRLAGVIAWAQDRLDRDVSIAELAAQARMSRRTFIRRFSAATGMPPGEWVRQARLERARCVLETTQLPIETVATTVGYGSADTLRHHFRTRLDTSPARYRSSFRARP